MKTASRYVVLIAGLVLLAACSDRPAEPVDINEEDHEEAGGISLSAEAYQASGIAVAPAVTARLIPTIRVTGTLSYDERRMAIATARIGGRITRAVADFGQRVSKGQVLAWIDSPELGAAQAGYLQAAGMIRLHEAEYQRAKLLLEGQAISRGEFLRREADWHASQVGLQAAERNLHILGLSQDDVERLSRDGDSAGHEYPVRSAVAGRVTERAAVPGRVVAADDELFTVADLGSLWLFLQVFEKDLPAVTEGAAVTLTCESHPEETFRGTIDFVGQVLDEHSRTVRARAVIDNRAGELKPGMFVYASIEGTRLDEADEPRLVVPKEAVAGVEGRDVVFVKVEERTFEIRPVVLGESSGERVEILSGLKEGEIIAVSGVFTLKSEALKGGLEEHHH
ncbi:MAG: efflux RND transporter periplasmic adaptor subunit [Acidobacteria bacterium]|uniref:Efflux RND transporter periplasmic adaptor subunit n=1 Tax=Candidatus Polarisedimenticola svalbardensis TaxID=2886004 RepID=A0A8J6XS53_9BACT|nr:efflux RND transporter periplasmic adaptor subunit [Candidatus Polarisedimenticola svalbardensis]